MGDLTLRSFINIHLLSLLDGSPHEVPLQKVIPLDLGHYRNPRAIDMQISDSRIALVIEVSSFTMARQDIELIAWEWKTGEVVNGLSLWYASFNSPQPRRLTTRVMTRISAAQSPPSSPYASWRVPGYSPCAMEAPLPSYSSSTCCYHGKIRGAGESLTSPRFPTLCATLNAKRRWRSTLNSLWIQLRRSSFCLLRISEH